MYVRQSTFYQVMNNQESGRRQAIFRKMLLHLEGADHRLLHYQAAQALLLILLGFRRQFRHGAKQRFTLFAAPAQKNAREGE